MAKADSPYNAPFVKVCAKCSEPKSSDEFYLHPQTRDGRRPRCIACTRQDMVEWRAAHKDQLKIQRRVYRQKHKEKIAVRRARWVRTPSGQESRRAAMWRHKVKLRMEMIAAYGGACECCGEDTYEFLTLEHKNGGGGKHRRERGTLGVLVELKRLGWPKDGYTILCMNCNHAKKDGKPCPHEVQRQRSQMRLLS